MDAVWPFATLVAASVSMQETINADDQPSRVVSNANRRLLSLPRRLHPRKPKFREALVRSIRPLQRGRHGVAGTSIGLEIALPFFGTRQCEPIFDTNPQNAIRAAIGAAGKNALTGLIMFRRFRYP
jgi:hypothetical protein